MNGMKEVKEPVLPYRSSAKRSYDLIHTKLNLRFDWERQHVIGEAELTVSPLIYPIDEFIFDAKGMIIHNVKQFPSHDILSYAYENDKLSVKTPGLIEAGDEIVIYIKYTARPDDSEGYASGAITSDKGLFFIDPQDEDPNKPTQIWTQGQTENNSRWFPTFDKPNERCTQEMYITVKEEFSTLSNGKLISQETHRDGTRTDYWKMEKPHPPYLFMLAVGQFSWVNDRWRDVPLHYIVEPEYQESAQTIFDHTPEMMEYFSEILNYPYPWEKYAQVVTRDYVSGAMENTTASIFGDFVQKHKRELIDNDNDYIVAHELFHHWFGDLVTCESWANLTLNEGFANYSEYLWAEHNDGRMKADHHRLNEMEGYISSSSFHPLIHYRYADKENMFDAHSYNKGGLVLHMLRNYVGDKAFFASLNKYLKDNQFTAVEVDELRMAFEDTTGEDLNWFFDQWYLQEGHPIINVKYDYDETEKNLRITTFQIGKQIFNIPYNVAVYDLNGNKTYHTVWTKNEMDTFYLQNITRPSTVVFDGTNTNLAIITEEGKSELDYLNQFKYSDLFLDKYLAFNRAKSGSETKLEIAQMALTEDYYLFREMALDYFMQAPDQNLIAKEELMDITLNDPHSSVRLRALEFLTIFPELDILPVLDSIIKKDQSYPIVSFALGYLSSKDFQKAEQIAKNLENEKTSMLNEGIAAVYSQAKEDKHSVWFENQISNGSIFDNLPVYMGYTAYTLRHNPSRTSSIIDELLKGAIDQDNGLYQRYFHTLTLSQIKNIIDGSKNNSMKDKIGVALDVIKDKEQNPMLQSYYRQM